MRGGGETLSRVKGVWLLESFDGKWRNTFLRGLRIAAMEDHDNATITGQRFNETQ